MHDPRPGYDVMQASGFSVEEHHPVTKTYQTGTRDGRYAAHDCLLPARRAAIGTD
jgi:hypothetical protein